MADDKRFTIRVEQLDAGTHLVLTARWRRADYGLESAHVDAIRPHCANCSSNQQALDRLAGQRGGIRRRIVDAALETGACGLLPDLLLESLEGAIQTMMHLHAASARAEGASNETDELRYFLAENTRLRGTCLAFTNENPEFVHATRDLEAGPIPEKGSPRPPTRPGLAYQRTKDFVARNDPNRTTIRGRMVDTVHEMAVWVDVDPATLTILDVRSISERYPQAICASAATRLSPAIGRQLARPVVEDFARHLGRAGCSHLSMLLVDSCTIAADILGGGLTMTSEESCSVLGVLDGGADPHRR